VQAGGLDPVHYYISSMFTQVLVSSVTLIVAPLIDRTFAVSWLGSLGGVVLIKFLLILWAGTLWRVMFRSRNRNLAEILVFTTHISATISLLWTPLPLIDQQCHSLFDSRDVPLLMFPLKVCMQSQETGPERGGKRTHRPGARSHSVRINTSITTPGAARTAQRSRIALV
jgi:hypothetical protein